MAAQTATPSTLAGTIEQQARALIEAARAGDGAEIDRPSRLRTEIEMSPQELGRVRLTIRDTAQGPHLQIVADRPETLDLVRRNLEALHRSLASDGVTLAGLDLGDGRGTDRPEGRPPSLAAPDGEDLDMGDPHLPDAPLATPASTARLDLRL